MAVSAKINEITQSSPTGTHLQIQRMRKNVITRTKVDGTPHREVRPPVMYVLAYLDVSVQTETL